MSKRKTTVEFIQRAEDIHGDKYDYSKVIYVNNRTKVCIICPTHGEFHMTPNNHIDGHQGCSECVGLKRLSTSIFTQRALVVHGNQYDYSKVDYINAYTDVIIICLEHGEFPQQPNNHIHGQGCPRCKTSKGNKRIQHWLLEHNIKHNPEKTFDDCRNKRLLPFDFYLPEYNTCIEYDGEQHFHPIKHWGGEDYFIKRQQTDNKKTKYCKDNNIKLIRIPYYDFDKINEIMTTQIK